MVNKKTSKLEKKQTKEAHINQKLKKEMLAFYKKQNEKIASEELTKQEWLKKKLKRILLYIGGLLATVIISLVATNFVSKKYNLPSTYWWITFFFLIISIFTVVQAFISGDIQSNRFHISLLVNLLVALILFGQFNLVSIQTSYMGQQTDILEKQAEILKISNPPFRAAIDLNIQSRTVQTFSRADIIRINKDKRSGDRFELQVTNIGKMDSGPVQIWLNNNWTYKWDGIYFANISSGESKYDWMYITTKKCGRWYFEDSSACDINDVPLGEQKLEFEIFCAKCKPDYSYQNLTICIWENFTRDCGKFKVTYD